MSWTDILLTSITALLAGTISAMGMGGGGILLLYLTAFAGVAQLEAQEEELATKSARLEELNALLNMDQRDNELAEPSAEEMEEQNDRNAPRRSRGVER